MGNSEREADTAAKVRELHNSLSDGSAAPATHYVYMNDAGSTFAKEADFFIKQGGLTDPWGKAWIAVVASSDDDARQKAKSIFIGSKTPPSMPWQHDEPRILSTREEPAMTYVSNEPPSVARHLSKVEKLLRVEEVLRLPNAGRAPASELAEMIVEAMESPEVRIDDLGDHMALSQEPNIGELGADGHKWAKAFVRITTRKSFEVPNLWDIDYMTGWFANAIEASRLADGRSPASKDAAQFKKGYDAGMKDARLERKSTWQDWVHKLPLMQQAVLASAVRAPDGMRKFHPAKRIVRWYRRSILLSAFDGKPLLDPHALGGGSFTGPLEPHMTLSMALDDFMTARDEMSLHYYAHIMHAAQIVGCYHPDDMVREFWDGAYHRMVNALHLMPEGYLAMADRLSDNPEAWARRADETANCTD